MDNFDKIIEVMKEEFDEEIPYSRSKDDEDNSEMLDFWNFVTFVVEQEEPDIINVLFSVQTPPNISAIVIQLLYEIDINNINISGCYYHIIENDEYIETEMKDPYEAWMYDLKKSLLN